MPKISLALWLLVVAGSLSALADETPPPKPSARTDLYGDPLPEGAVLRLGTVRFRARPGFRAGPACSVAISPDGRTVASGSSQGFISLWEAATGKERARFKAHQAYIDPLLFLPDGSALLSAGDDKAIRLWDLTTLKEVRRLEGEFENVRSLALSPDGKLVAAGGNDTLRLWELATGKALPEFEGRRSYVEAVAFSPDGRFVATGGKRECLDLWEVATRKLVRSFDAETFGWVDGVAFSRDGRHLYSVGCHYHQLRVWDVATGRQLRQEKTSTGSTGARTAATPDRRLLAVVEAAGGPAIALHDLATGKVSRIGVPDREFEVRSLALSFDGRSLAFTGKDGNRIHLWDLVADKPSGRGEGHDHRLGAVAYSPDGKVLATRSQDQTIRLWDAATSKELRRLECVGAARALAFSPDGKLLAAGAGDDKSARLRFWRPATGEEVALPGPQTQPGIEYLAFSPDGRTLALVGRLPSVGLCDAATGKELERFGDPMEFRANDPLRFVAFTADGKFVVDGGSQYVIHYLNLATRDRRQVADVGEGYRADAAACSPEGRLLATTGEGTAITFRELGSGRKRGRIELGKEETRCLAFSPDGRTVAWGGSEGEIRVFETATREERCRFTGHHGATTALAYSPHGKQLASASADTTGLVWDLYSGRKVRDQKTQDLLAKEWDDFWADLASPKAAAGYRAVCLGLSSPRQAVAFLRDKLSPAVGPTKEALARLIAELDSDRFPVRQKATQELEKLGELAVPALKQALEARPTLEIQRRLEQLLAKVEDDDLSSEEIRNRRALEVLEHAAHPEAVSLLEKLTEGTEGARQTREAKASLARRVRFAGAQLP